MSTTHPTDRSLRFTPDLDNSPSSYRGNAGSGSRGRGSSVRHEVPTHGVRSLVATEPQAERGNLIGPAWTAKRDTAHHPL